jgi:2-polyprenyl-6-methoxyphenol hydroxylase-like FAD-dependent oxidoreductase
MAEPYSSARSFGSRVAEQGRGATTWGGRDVQEQPDDVPVAIVGGGLVGLSTAMFLAQHGIASLTVERLRGGSPLPRAAHFHLRTLELFRAAGIDAEVRAQSEKEFLPEGAIVAMDSLAGRKLADIVPSLNVGVDDTLSPCRRLFVSQPGLEPLLRRRAERAGARLLEGHEVVAADQDSEGVTLTLRDGDTDAVRDVRARYVVAAEGAHSRLREAMGISFEGRGVFSNSITIYFTADLAPQMLGKPLSVIYINNAVFGGFFRLDKECQSGFLVVNTVGAPGNPDIANAAGDTSEARLVELVRAGAGVPDLDVRIDGVARWRASSDVARHYGHGRIFFVGDAAHVMPPNGGFGGNTGIHDAHDLAWKLAFVLNGAADPALLSTYEAERRPVGVLTVEQAYARYVTRTATYLGATDYQPIAPDLEVEMGYVYRSPAISSDGDESGDAGDGDGDESGDAGDGDGDGDGDDEGAAHADPRLTAARPGTRAPHVWIERDGVAISTLDLFGRSFVLVAGEGGDEWRQAAAEVGTRHSNVPLTVLVAGTADLAETDRRVADAFGLDGPGAVLVRPDGFVAWRTPSPGREPARALGAAFDAALMTAGTPT